MAENAFARNIRLVLERQSRKSNSIRPQLEDRKELETPKTLPPGGEIVFKEQHDRFQESDRELLDTGHMSDCTVICRDVKWSTHKDILCGRNKWFRTALDGPFKEASTGVITIEDTDPDVVQTVLEYIYTGEIIRKCPTPASIIEIWKAGDFFDVPDLVDAAQNALSRRLRASAGFLHFSPGPKKKPPKNTHCQPLLVKYGLCGHFVRENREFAVRNVQPQTVFHLCEPERISYRDSKCDSCEAGSGNFSGSCSSNASLNRKKELDAEVHSSNSIRSAHQEAPDRPTPPDDETRAMIEDEIRTLCEALLVATVDTPQDSRIQKALINHMCSTRVAAWGGFTVCRFLDS